MYHLDNIWSTPIFKSSIEIDNKTINQFKNINFIRLNMENGSRSENTYILNDKKFEDLRNKIFFNVDVFLYNILGIKKNINFKMLNSWVMLHKQNDWSQEHYHKNSYLSGIYYIDVNEKSGNLYFHKNKDLNNLFPYTPEIEIETYNEINCKTKIYTPEKFNLFLFPSSVSHSVEKNLSTKNRYSLAFNFFPTGNFGKKEELDYISIL